MIYDKNIDSYILYKHEESEKIKNINELHNKADSIENLLNFFSDNYS